MPNFEVVLFDLDGTLMDNTEVIVDIYRRAMLSLGLNPPSDGYIASLGGKSTFATAQAMDVPEEFLNSVDKFFWTEFRKYCETMDTQPVLLPGVEEFLSFLQERGTRMGVVTSNESKNARFLLGKAGLLDKFEIVIGREEVTEYKPSPVPLLTALSTMDISSWDRSTVVYIGDTASDVLSAKRAGIFSIQLTEGESEADFTTSRLSRIRYLFDDSD